MHRALTALAVVVLATGCDDGDATPPDPTPDMAPAADMAPDVAPQADMSPAVDATPDPDATIEPDAAPDPDAAVAPDADLDATLEPDEGPAPVDAGPDGGAAACPGPFARPEFERDLHYGPAPRQVFDLAVPDAPGPLPVFVWIHGGGWQGGDQSRLPPQGAALAEQGMAVMSITYRLSETAFPTTVSDVRQAIRWIYTEGPDRGLDPSRIVVAGSSAGGHLAAILGTAADVAALDLEPAEPEPRVHLVVDFFGPSELLQMDADAVANGCGAGALCHDCADSPEARLIDCEAELSTCPEPAILVSPVTHVDATDPPFVVLHGDQDCTVPTPQGRRMHEALVAAGVESELHIVPGAGHNVGQVGTAESWAAIQAAIDRRILRCDRDAPPPAVDGGLEGPLDGCLYETCPDEAAVCAADPDCVAFEACFRECRGTAGCVADCSAGLPQASVGRHRAMYMCANPAGCYR